MKQIASLFFAQDYSLFEILFVGCGTRYVEINKECISLISCV